MGACDAVAPLESLVQASKQASAARQGYSSEQQQRAKVCFGRRTYTSARCDDCEFSITPPGRLVVLVLVLVCLVDLRAVQHKRQPKLGKLVRNRARPKHTRHMILTFGHF